MGTVSGYKSLVLLFQKHLKSTAQPCTWLRLQNLHMDVNSVTYEFVLLIHTNNQTLVVAMRTHAHTRAHAPAPSRTCACTRMHVRTHHTQAYMHTHAHTPVGAILFSRWKRMHLKDRYIVTPFVCKTLSLAYIQGI